MDKIAVTSGNMEKVKFIREEIRFQHGLLGIRISWLLAAEAFFFTAFAISRGSIKCNELVYFWKWIVPLSAAFIATLTLPAIFAAIKRIDKQRSILLTYELKDLLPIGDEKDQDQHSLSLLVSKAIPFVFIIAWIVICIASEPSPSPSPTTAQMKFEFSAGWVSTPLAK